MFTILSSKDFARLQRLQNSAARVIFAVSRSVDATPLLEALHWLLVSSRITFKILLYVLKILNSQALGYLTELLSYYKPAWCLRSSRDPPIPPALCFICDKRFQIVAAKSWNLLPIEFRTVTSIVTFKKLLKTFLFWFCCFLIVLFVFFCKRYGTCVNGYTHTCLIWGLRTVQLLMINITFWFLILKCRNFLIILFWVSSKLIEWEFATFSKSVDMLQRRLIGGLTSPQFVRL